MKKLLLVVIIGFVAILSGCATNKFEVKGINLESGVQTLNFLIEPFESLGVAETEAIKKGEITVVKAVFPELLFGEYFPGRVRWNALGVDESGREYFGQAVFSGISFTGDFLFTIAMDGKVPADAKIMILSTGLSFAYDFAGNEFALNATKIGDASYRKDFIIANGSRIGDMKRDEQFVSLIRKWNKFQTPSGKLLSPLGEKELKEVAAINPKYSYSEKLVGSGNFTLVADYVGIAVGLAFDILRAPGVPSEGWDYNSQLPSRRNMALIIKYVKRMQDEVVKKLNLANAELYSKSTQKAR